MHGIKRKKIETIPPVDLDNDDACSEDAFIRKIASSNSSGKAVPVESSVAAPQIVVVHRVRTSAQSSSGAIAAPSK